MAHGFTTALLADLVAARHAFGIELPNPFP